jgi:hypothetical protein
MEDFESAPAGSIDGWEALWQELASANGSVIQELESHSGLKYLEVLATSSISTQPLTECIEWYNNSLAAAQSCWSQLSWWMKCSAESNWKIALKDSNGEEVCTIRNSGNGSTGTIDVLTHQGWQEIPAAIAPDVWTEFILQLDFCASPVKYRLCVGDCTSWCDWYTLGIDAEHIGSFELFNNCIRTCYDDFCLSIIPEPSTIGILSLGSLILFQRRRI